MAETEADESTKSTKYKVAWYLQGWFRELAIRSYKEGKLPANEWPAGWDLDEETGKPINSSQRKNRKSKIKKQLKDIKVSKQDGRFVLRTKRLVRVSKVIFKSHVDQATAVVSELKIGKDYDIKQVLESQEVEVPAWDAIPELLKRVHNNEEHHHAEKMQEKLSQDHGVYWWGMLQDCKYVCKTCDACIKASPSGGLDAKWAPIVAKQKNERWQVDFICAMRDTLGGKDSFYVLHVVDCWSKYTWAKAFLTKEAAPVVQFMEELIQKHGKPTYLQYDNGTEFFGLDQLCLRLDIIKAKPLPYNPKANGQIERVNGTLKKQLLKKLLARGGSAKEALQQCLTEYHNTIHSTTKFKPEYLYNGNPTVAEQLLVNRNLKLAAEKTERRSLEIVKLKNDGLAQQDDFVRIFMKPGGRHQKMTSWWSDPVAKVVNSGPAHTEVEFIAQGPKESHTPGSRHKFPNNQLSPSYRSDEPSSRIAPFLDDDSVHIVERGATTVPIDVDRHPQHDNMMFELSKAARFVLARKPEKGSPEAVVASWLTSKASALMKGIPIKAPKCSALDVLDVVDLLRDFPLSAFALVELLDELMKADCDAAGDEPMLDAVQNDGVATQSPPRAQPAKRKSTSSSVDISTVVTVDESDEEITPSLSKKAKQLATTPSAKPHHQNGVAKSAKSAGNAPSSISTSAAVLFDVTASEPMTTSSIHSALSADCRLERVSQSRLFQIAADQGAKGSRMARSNRGARLDEVVASIS